MNTLTRSFAPYVPNTSAAALTGQAFTGYSCAGYSIYVVYIFSSSVDSGAREARAPSTSLFPAEPDLRFNRRGRGVGYSFFVF